MVSLPPQSLEGHTKGHGPGCSGQGLREEPFWVHGATTQSHLGPGTLRTDKVVGRGCGLTGQGARQKCFSVGSTPHRGTRCSGQGHDEHCFFRAKQAIHTLISKFPQCAYIRGRSTGSALRQVFFHCKEVRDSCTCTQARLTIRQKFEGREHTECQGGIQASLDLSGAFDLVQWSSVKQALDLAGVELAVQDILMSWLSQARYLFRHKHLRGLLRPRKGLRQGCTGSPILWSAFTALLCTTIEHRLHQQSSREHLSLCADDSHLRWRFDSYQGFNRLWPK